MKKLLSVVAIILAMDNILTPFYYAFGDETDIFSLEENIVVESESVESDFSDDDREGEKGSEIYSSTESQDENNQIEDIQDSLVEYQKNKNNTLELENQVFSTDVSEGEIGNEENSSNEILEGENGDKGEEDTSSSTQNDEENISETQIGNEDNSSIDNPEVLTGNETNSSVDNPEEQGSGTSNESSDEKQNNEENETEVQTGNEENSSVSETEVQTGNDETSVEQSPNDEDNQKETPGILDSLSEEVKEIVDKIRYFFKGVGDNRYIKYGKDGNNVGTITLKDPKTSATITIMDKNLGAGSAGVGKNSYGYYFQWGNNHGVVNTSNKTTKKAIYEDSYYNHGYDGGGVFIVGSTDYWEDGAHYNSLWGNESKEFSRQAACPAGYHIPTIKEWNKLLSIWGKIHTQDESTNENGVNLRYSENSSTKNIHVFKDAATHCEQGDTECVDEDKLSSIIEILSSELKLPLAGSYDEYGNFHDGLGVYWTTTTKDGNKAGVFNVDAYLGGRQDETLLYKAQGHNIRCFQNIEKMPENNEDNASVPEGEPQEDGEESGLFAGVEEENTSEQQTGSGENSAEDITQPSEDATQIENPNTTGVQTYIVTWRNEDGTVRDITTVPHGQKPVHEDAVQPADEQYTYVFAGWEPEISEATGDVEYTAKYTYVLNQYNVTWKNEDGTVLKSDKVEYGTTPSYNGPTPTKQPTEFTYIFEGWTPAISVVKGDVTYKATYTTGVPVYTITRKNEDGTVIDATQVAYGEIPTHEDVVQPADDNFSYEFLGWNPEISETVGNAEYTATYKYIPKKYTITWKNEDGTIRDTTQVAYGEMPTHEDITQPADEHYTYMFNGWDPEIREVTGDAEYRVKYTYVTNQYNITWENEDGTVLKSDKVEYGTIPTYDGEIPEKQSDGIYEYSFDGWESEISAVTGDVVYIAKYSVTEISKAEDEKSDDDILESTDSLEEIQDNDISSGGDGGESQEDEKGNKGGDEEDDENHEVIEIQDSLDEDSESQGEDQGFFESILETLKSFFLEDEDGYLRGSETIDNIIVSVEAEEGTFPEGTEVIIKGVPQDRLESIQSSLIEDENNNVRDDAEILAFDISFVYSGEEIQPLKEVSVKFNYKENTDFQGASELSVYHIDDESDEGEEIEVVSKTEDEIEILATSFSTYAVVAQKGLRNAPVSGRGIMDQMPDFVFNGIIIYKPDSLSGIYQNSPEGYVVMDRNLGATSNGIVCDTESNIGVCGLLYQFGNNYGLGYGTIDIVRKYTEESVDLTLYSPSNPYYDSRFVRGSNDCNGSCSNKDWAVVSNPGIWGGANGDYSDRQGPCPDGWYVPTKQEWQEVVDYWTVGESNQGTGVLNSHNINAFRNYFQLPLGGERTRSDAVISKVGVEGSYFTTEPNDGNPYILRITTSNGAVNSTSNYNLVNGYSVRCFKNISAETYLVTYNDGVEGEEIFPDQTGSVAFGGNYPEFSGSLEREGYQFSGWVELIGSDEIFDIENNRVIQDITLYAKWKLICPEGEYERLDNQCHTEAELQRLNQIVVDLDLYHLISDGSTGNKQYTIMDRNMGATSIYDKNYTSPNNASKGYLYQWGNNYGFPSIGKYLPDSVLTTTNPVPKSIWGEYVPSRYASGVYYYNSNKDGNWMAGSTSSDGIWGGTGDTYLANGIGTTLEGRQGPCPVGYHVPSTVEWQNLFDLYPGDETTNSDLYNFTNDLLIPPVGRRAGNGQLDMTKALSYWSSSPSTGNTKAMGFYWDKDKVIERYQSDGRARARSVRCFKNTGSEFVSKEDIHLNGGTDVFISIHSGTILSLGTPTLTSAQSAQATFDGWYTTSDFSGNPLSTGDTVQAGSSLYAKFTCNETGYIWNGTICEDGVRLIFDSMGGSEVSSQLIKSGSTGVRPANPTKTGYVFNGWFLTGAIEEFDFTGTIITGETTVYAHWNTGEYEVSIVSNNTNYGTVDENSVTAEYLTPITTNGNVLTIGSTTITATPETGDEQYTYTFSGWTNTCGETLTTGCTITANFDRIRNSYTVTINATPEGYGSVDSGTVISSYGTSITTNENILTIGTETITATPTASGEEYTYTFSGWTNTCGETVMTGCTITAIFDRTTNEYIVSFDSNGGNYTPNNQTVAYGSNATKPTPDPTKIGYIFGSWTLNGNDFDFNTPITGNTNLVARWIDNTDPTVTLIAKTNTVNTTNQTATLKCSDGVGVTAYYWGTTEPISASEITTTTSLSTLISENGLDQTIDTAGTYYLGCRDDAGNFEVQSLTYVQYQVKNMLDSVEGTTGIYTTENYSIDTTMPTDVTYYIIQSGTNLTLSELCTTPTISSTRKITSEGEPSTIVATNISIVEAINTTYACWFDRDTYTLDLIINTGIDSIYYMINGANSYSNTGVTTTINGIKAGSQITGYAVAKNGYTHTETSESNPWSVLVTGNNVFSPEAIGDVSTEYIVYHYVKRVGENTYALTKTETGYGTIDEILILSGLAKSNEFPCAHYDSGSLTGTEAGPGLIVTGAVIRGDGTTEIYLYYVRDYYNVTLSGDAHVDSLEGDGVRECGSEIPVNATPKPGYHFVRWDREERSRREEGGEGLGEGGEGGEGNPGE